jgi:UMF1 family MFS transporter
MYDWANSAFATTIMAGFFPIFFKQFWSFGTDAIATTAKLGFANAVAGIVIALSAPVLGAIADRGRARKKILLAFALMGIVATSSLYLVAKGQWQMAAALYVLAIIGFSGGNIFYDALLTAVASEKKIDMISSMGYSLGYLGGGILFAFNVWMTLQPEAFGLPTAAEAVRLSFLSVGLWWMIFSIPLIIFVKEPGAAPDKFTSKIIKDGISQLKNTFREIRHLKNIFLFLAAYWLYIDGVDTIIVMAINYGLSIGFQSQDLILALLITQFIGFPSAIAFGFMGEKMGTKRAIFAALAVYLLIPLWGACMQQKWEFYLLAITVGLVQGGIQALSRSFFARLIPADKSAEYFGFYNMIGKFATVIGPLLIGGTGLWISAMGFSSLLATRFSILSVSLLFLAGGILFYFVDEKKGREAVQYLSQN